MTNTTNTTEITVDPYDHVAEATAALEQARRDLADRETAAAEGRRDRARQAWQAWVDTWPGPTADAQAVTDAEHELTAALSESRLGHALVAYLAAALRAEQHRDLAQAAAAAGATVPDSTARIAPAPWARSVSGPGAGNVEEYARGLFPRILVKAARGIADTEAAHVRHDVERAVDAEPGGRPVAWRIRTLGNRTGNIDNTFGLVWRDGTTYLPLDDPHLSYFRRRTTEHAVEPVYGDPREAAELVAASRATTDTPEPARTGIGVARPGVFTLTPAQRDAANLKARGIR